MKINIQDVIDEIKKREQKIIDIADFLNSKIDFRYKVRRGIVHDMVSEHFNLKINNYLIADIRKSLEKLNVVPIMVQHNRFYRNKNYLRKRIKHIF